MRQEAVRVRKAVAADIDVVFEIAKEFVVSFTLDRSAFEHSFCELITANDAAVLVLELAGEVLGYCLAFDHATFYANGRVTWVEEIAVRSDKRGLGLGRELMEAVETWARSRNSKLVALATRRAAAFYKALHYDESAVYFRKLLPPA